MPVPARPLHRGGPRRDQSEDEEDVDEDDVDEEDDVDDVDDEEAAAAAAGFADDESEVALEEEGAGSADVDVLRLSLR